MLIAAHRVLRKPLWYNRLWMVGNGCRAPGGMQP